MAPRTDTVPKAERPRLSPRALGLLAVVAVLGYGIDQGTKFLVETGLERNVAVPVIGELLQFRYVTNPGAAFSFATGFTWVLSVIAVVVIVVIIVFAPRIRSLAWSTMFGLLLAGAFGNLTDRLTRPPGFGVGHVVDFIQIWGFPAIFNVADIAIVTSMGLFLLLSLRNVGLDGVRRVDDRWATPDADLAPARDAE